VGEPEYDEKAEALEKAFYEKFEDDDRWSLDTLDVSLNPKASTFGKETFMPIKQAEKFLKNTKGVDKSALDAVHKGTKVVDQSDGSPCVVSYPRKGSFEVWFFVRAGKKDVAHGCCFTRIRCSRFPDVDVVVERMRVLVSEAMEKHDHQAEAEARKAKADKAFKAHEASKKALEAQAAVESAGKAQGGRRGRRGSVAQAVEAAGAAVAAAAEAVADAAKAVVDTITRTSTTQEGDETAAAPGAAATNTRASPRTSAQTRGSNASSDGRASTRASTGRRKSVVEDMMDGISSLFGGKKVTPVASAPAPAPAPA